MKTTKSIISEIVTSAKRENKKLGERNTTIELILEIQCRKSGNKEWYEFKIGEVNYQSETNNFKEIEEFCKYIDQAIAELKNLKGYRVGSHKGTFYNDDACNYIWNCNRTKSVLLTDGIILFAEPSKEFKSMARWIDKLTAIKLDELDLYSVGIGGKRGRIYGEDGYREYLCHDSEKCRRILDWIIKNKSSRDTLKVELKTTDEIDEFNLQVSIRNETEFCGTRHSHMTMTITTPGGKVKAKNDSIYI